MSAVAPESADCLEGRTYRLDDAIFVLGPYARRPAGAFGELCRIGRDQRVLPVSLTSGLDATQLRESDAYIHHGQGCVWYGRTDGRFETRRIERDEQSSRAKMASAPESVQRTVENGGVTHPVGRLRGGGQTLRRLESDMLAGSIVQVRGVQVCLCYGYTVVGEGGDWEGRVCVEGGNRRPRRALYVVRDRVDVNKDPVQCQQGDR